jgi:HlyD family secretion protein
MTGPSPRRAIRRLEIAGFAMLIVFFGVLGGWAATSQLSGAVIASGSIVLESSLKKVQRRARF